MIFVHQLVKWLTKAKCIHENRCLFIETGNGYASSTNDLRSQRVNTLKEFGVKIFAGLFPSTVIDMNPKDPKLSVEIMSFRDVRAALEYEANTILSCAMNSPQNVDAMDLVRRCLIYDVLILVKIHICC